ncbi:hypothetical protein ABLE68_11550 [Nocardioides sp. CN2-186]|uniref:hypothetical protein n=1 Tax=Nocardioides tweenelious TaxID=3156607 RepID=UPI0032B42BC6
MNDDELQARLRAADPASSLPPADPDRVARLLEDVMSTELTTEKREDGTQGRGPLTWLVAAAAVVVLLVGGIIGIKAATGDNASPTSAKPEPAQTVTTLSAPDDGATHAKCMVPNAQTLAQMPTAFDGTVSVIDGDTVTLTTTKWYAGEPTDVVKVTAPGEEWERLLSAVHFEAGQRYLVSATDEGAVTVCGFSAAYSDDLSAVYAEAFPG